MDVKDLDAATARQWLDEGRAELIDIRDAGERRRLRVPAARWMPLAGLDAGLKAEPRGAVGIFHCQSGRRTRMHADRLAAVGYAETYVLAGGIQAWRQAGGPVTSDSGAIDIMRQVQIVAGGLIVAGALAGAWIDPGFHWLSGLVGAGLLYSGLSGSCGMAMLLGKLPFNR